MDSPGSTHLIGPVVDRVRVVNLLAQSSNHLRWRPDGTLMEGERGISETSPAHTLIGSQQGAKGEREIVKQAPPTHG